MALSIKNAEISQLARQLTSSGGVSATEAIRQNLENEIACEGMVSQSGESELIVKLREISERAGRIPKRDHPMTEDEILGYDEFGIPTR